MAILEYCDYIGDRIRKALLKDTEVATSLIKDLTAVKMDLDPDKGYLLSTKKTIDVTDINGKLYRVTVECLDNKE